MLEKREWRGSDLKKYFILFIYLFIFIYSLSIFYIFQLKRIFSNIIEKNTYFSILFFLLFIFF